MNRTILGSLTLSGAIGFVGMVACAFASSCSSSSNGGGGSIDAGSPLDSGASLDGSSTADAADAHAPLRFSDIGTPVLMSDQFYFTEGPVWDPTKGVLYFTDINATQGGTTTGAIYQLTPPSTINVFLQPSGNVDGLGLDPSGKLLGAGFVSRSVWRLSDAKTQDVLSPCTGVEGGTCFTPSAGTPTVLNTPDDVTVRADGVIYFTDPTFGSNEQGFPELTLPLAGAQGVYRLTTDGVLHLEDSTVEGPNGVNLSPDQKTLYVAYTLSGIVAKFDVAADGSLSNKTIFAQGLAVTSDAGTPTLDDSMCVDSGGNVYVATSTGLSVFDAAGTHLGTISVGGLLVTNCAFGGADQKTLFITARTLATLKGAPPLGGGALYQIPNMPVPGIAGQN